MARKPVSCFRRPLSKKGQYRYYVKLWVEVQNRYTVPRSVESIAHELDLNKKAFPPTSRTGALLIGEELRRRGGAQPRTGSLLFADYCAETWNWDESPYIKAKLARGQRIGREYVDHNAAYVKTYIAPAFPFVILSGVKPYMLEDFVMKLKKETELRNRSINAILSAATVPLHETARLGLIDTDPAASIRKLGNDTAEKGIPTEEEIRGLLNLDGLDARIHGAILLGAACALRIGEIQALTLGNVGESTLRVGNSWGKVDGLKDTKTGRVRVVPLPRTVRSALLDLVDANPHGPAGFLIYGVKPDAPLDVRAIERGFDNALVRLSLGDSYASAPREAKEKTLFAWKARRVTFHSLRHWNNAMLRGSVSDSKLHLLTGHSTEAMTNRYDHATEADLAELSRAQEAKILPFLVSPKVLSLENDVKTPEIIFWDKNSNSVVSQ